MYAACEDSHFIVEGQSPVRMMSLRLAAPCDRSDLNAIDDLSGISQQGEELIVCIASKVCARPVKYIEAQFESFVATPRG